MKYIRWFSSPGDKPKVYHLDKDCRHTNDGRYVGIEVSDERLEENKIRKVCGTC